MLRAHGVPHVVTERNPAAVARGRARPRRVLRRRQEPALPAPLRVGDRPRPHHHDPRARRDRRHHRRRPRSQARADDRLAPATPITRAISMRRASATPSPRRSRQACSSPRPRSSASASNGSGDRLDPRQARRVPAPAAAGDRHAGAPHPRRADLAARLGGVVARAQRSDSSALRAAAICCGVASLFRDTRARAVRASR